MRGFKRLWAVVGTVGLVAAGCGGGGSACENVGACGGDLVGDWDIVSYCAATSVSGAGAGLDMAGAGLDNFCSQATVDTSGIRVTGSMSFKPDMTYTETETLSGTMSMTLPAACLRQGNVTATCAQVEQSANAGLSGDPTTRDAIGPIKCSGSAGGGCACRMPFSQPAAMGTGVYSTSGSVLTQSGSDQSDYCVKGTTLYLKPHQSMTMSMGSMGSVDVNEQVVLEKK